MRFDKKKKEAITLYLLEKINSGTEGLAVHVASVFGVNKSTVHRYLNELIDSDVIEKSGQGSYRLCRKEYHFSFRQSGGDLESDTYLYTGYLAPVISGLKDNVTGIWDYAISEMTNNIIDHSQAESVELSIFQDRLRTSVILQDDGIGIFNKIREHFNYPSIEDAVSELFKGKLTTDEINHSGEGIFFTSRLMDSFFIVSSGKVFTCNRYDDSELMELSTDNRPGTRIIMTLSNNSNKTAKEIFDKYADVDGGFTRTMIPVKNIFDNPPVSRSQAKRLCDRLDHFREVILDFDGVEWMGQAFAHQIFSVFADRYPDIKIIPRNMNGDVLKMYNHVTNGTPRFNPQEPEHAR